MNYLRRPTLSVRLLLLFALLTAACGPDEPGGDNNADTVNENSDTAELTDLFIHTEPATQITAGETFTIAVELLNDIGESFATPGIDITVALNRNEFADGTTTATTTTDEAGIAQFDLVIESADTGLALTATSDHDDLSDASATTGFFDIVAATAHPAHSSITGTDGTVHNQGAATITIVLIDVFENPVAGVTPEFTASGDGNTYGECTATDADGLATCTMTSTEAGPRTLELTAPIPLTGDTIEFFQWDCDPDGAPFGGGNGSLEEPYRLCSPDQLNAIGTGTFLADSFVLARSIDMADVTSFNIIGSEENPFTGHFHGVDNTIDHLTIERPEDDYLGLFAHIGEDGLVEHLGLTNVNIQGNRRVGGLAGESYGTITACHTSGEIASEDIRIGGLVGQNWGDIQNSHASVTISARQQAGGLVGFNALDATIVDSYATGDLLGTEISLGGLVGINNAVITGSYATGSVHGATATGGLAGRNVGTIEDSHASGTVEGSGRNTGGFVGNQLGSILNSYATGDVQGSDLFVGGFAGANTGSIEGSYSEAQVRGTADATGGFVGLNEGDLHGCYAHGEVEGVHDVGGFAGRAHDGSITASYATGSVSGEDHVGGFAGVLGHFAIGGSLRSTVEGSHASGDVIGTGDHIGGFAGTTKSSDITDCYAEGDVVGMGATIGGLVGYHSSTSTITTSYASGQVDGSAGPAGAATGGLVGQNNGSSILDSYATGDALGGTGNNVGGLVGFQFDGAIHRAYSSGLVEGAGLQVGGLVGGAVSSSTQDAYWDIDSSQINESFSGTSLTTGQFSDAARFENWDFTDIWTIDTAPDGETRPVLRWQ